MDTVSALKVVPLEIESSSNRHNRRAYLSPDVLRIHHLIAGEWVVLSSDRRDTRSDFVNDFVNDFVIAQLWPRAGIEDNGEWLSRGKR